ncbi:MAG: D-lyxose/D-mannose family sugar isomerase [Pseudomonadota bacterium]
MKRSQINEIIADFRQLLDAYRWTLPKWANYSVEDFAQKPELAHWLQRHQMGWDVTDFGSGDFAARGLALFCLRNGVQSDPHSVPYAEKLLFVGPGQETPFHAHKIKLEDIINRGGGDLLFEFRPGPGAAGAIKLRCDGISHELEADEPLVLKPGESVTIPRGLYHRFYGHPGGESVLVGEVSQVNDDGSDNYFWDELPRFAQIEEDEAIILPLWNEVYGSQ